jgi:hypothetical protein
MRGKILWTKYLYFIILSDPDVAYINLNYTFHTGSHDNDHFCFKPSINGEYTFSYFDEL